MAARRLANSSVDWTAFYQRVPAREREIFRALKARSDAFVNKLVVALGMAWLEMS